MSFGSILMLIVLSATVVPSSSTFSLFGSSKQVNKIFVFGDSTVDVGNNNYYTGDVSVKVIKANNKPYGVDYKNSKPTGRFSNGYNIADYIAKKLGFKESPPAYLAQGSIFTSMNLWLNGANFASGGSGVLNSTRSWLNMAEQIKLFKEYNAKKIVKFVTNLRISKSLFIISTGSNDVFNFYEQKTKNSDNPPQASNSFIEDLADNYKRHVEELYNLGARKFVILDVGMIGCFPILRMTPLHCDDKFNQLAESTNKAVAKGMKELSKKLGSMKYSLGSTYNFISLQTYYSLSNIGLEIKSPCCGGQEQLCTPTSSLCEDRSKYLFWDMTHATQKTVEMAANEFFEQTELIVPFITPISIKKLVET